MWGRLADLAAVTAVAVKLVCRSGGDSDVMAVDGGDDVIDNVEGDGAVACVGDDDNDLFEVDVI